MGKLKIIGIHKGGGVVKVNDIDEYANIGKLINREFLDTLQKWIVKQGDTPLFETLLVQDALKKFPKPGNQRSVDQKSVEMMPV